MTMTCGSSMVKQASVAARLVPSSTGKLSMPMRRSPDTDLKSFRVMMPCAPKL